MKMTKLSMSFSLSHHFLPVSDVDEDEKSFMGVTEDDNDALSTIFLAVHTHACMLLVQRTHTQLCWCLLLVCIVYVTHACVNMRATHACVYMLVCAAVLVLLV